jgi:hypothetical protein
MPSIHHPVGAEMQVEDYGPTPMSRSGGATNGVDLHR